MARQKKVYNSIDSKTNRHQLRGGGLTTRLNRKHTYPTQPLETPVSPTWTAARASKKLNVKAPQPQAAKV